MSVFQKKEKSDPLFIGVVLFAFLFAIIGAISGFMLLAFAPSKSFETVAEQENFIKNYPRESLLNSYWFEGPVEATPDLAQKRDRFLNSEEDATIEFSDGEINAWISTEFSKPRATFLLKDRPGILILPDLPNFFIDESVGFTFRIPMEIIIYGKAYYNSMIVQGRFVEDPESYFVEFQVETLRINDARIPLNKEWCLRLLTNLLQPYLKTDEFIDLLEAWEVVDSIELVDNTIRLNLD